MKSILIGCYKLNDILANQSALFQHSFATLRFVCDIWELILVSWTDELKKI